MKNNKANREKQLKHREKIAPPNLDYFKKNIIPECKKLKDISIKTIADRVFSRFVRKTNSDEEGYCTCCTCGVKGHRTGQDEIQMQNGHYKTRGNYKYRYDIQNCHPQCFRCNVLKNGNYRNYHIFMVNTYGEDVEKRIWEDTATAKLYDYDLIEKCVERHKVITKG